MRINHPWSITPGPVAALYGRAKAPRHAETLKGWATSVLRDAGAIRECEEHGWTIDRADPHAHDRAFDIARRDPPPGISSNAAAVVIAEVLESIGDACLDCPPD
jgi:hypothetical protein